MGQSCILAALVIPAYIWWDLSSNLEDCLGLLLCNALDTEITTQSRKRCFTCTSVSASFRIHNMVHCFPTMHSEGYIHFFIFGISTLTFGGVLPTYTIHKGWNR